MKEPNKSGPDVPSALAYRPYTGLSSWSLQELRCNLGGREGICGGCFSFAGWHQENKEVAFLVLLTLWTEIRTCHVCTSSGLELIDLASLRHHRWRRSWDGLHTTPSVLGRAGQSGPPLLHRAVLDGETVCSLGKQMRLSGSQGSATVIFIIESLFILNQTRLSA